MFTVNNCEQKGNNAIILEGKKIEVMLINRKIEIERTFIIQFNLIIVSKENN